MKTSSQKSLAEFWKQKTKPFRSILYTILCVLSALLVYPILCTIFFPIFIFRWCIQIFVRFQDPKIGHMLTGMNAILSTPEAYEKPFTVINPYIPLVSRLDRDHIVNVINEQVIKPNFYPELKQRIVRKYGYHFWYPVENFDVEHHVKYLNPDFPEKPVTRTELRRLGFQQVSQLPFDSRLSPWEVILVPNLIDENNPAVKSGLYIRANHCLMDGYSIINFIQKCASKPWIIPVAQAYLQRKTGFKEFLKRVVFVFKFICTAPYHSVKQLCFSKDNTEFIKKAIFQSINEKQKWGSIEMEPRRIDGQRLKDLKNKLNVSMSSLILTLSAEGIIRFIKFKCNQKFSKLPDKIYLHMAFPLPGHPDAMTNHWSTVRIPIGLRKDHDPARLLNYLQKQFEYFKYSVIPHAIFVISELIGALPLMLIPDLKNSPLIQTIILTNIPGAVEKVDVFGYEADSFGLTGSSAEGSAFVAAVHNMYGKFWIDVGIIKTISKSQEDLYKVEDLVHGVLDDLEMVANNRLKNN